MAINCSRFGNRSVAVEQFFCCIRPIEQVDSPASRKGGGFLPFSIDFKDINLRREAINPSDEYLITRGGKLLNAPVGFGHDILPMRGIRIGYINPNDAEVWSCEVCVSHQLTTYKNRGDKAAFDLGLGA